MTGTITEMTATRAHAVHRAQNSSQRLGERLLAQRLINEGQLKHALEVQPQTSRPIGRVLVELGILDEDRLTAVLSVHLNFPAADLRRETVDPDAAQLVPADFARKHVVLPMSRQNGDLLVAMADPVNLPLINDMRLITGLGITPYIAGPSDILANLSRINSMRPRIHEAARSLEESRPNFGVVRTNILELSNVTASSPAVDIVNMLITQGLRDRASDIHVEPQKDYLRIRFRVDGVLHEIMIPPKRLEPALISRVKIMANLDIAERRLPQDGRIKLRYNTHEIDFRVSTLPTIYGEKTVMRLLDKDSLQLDLTKLGFDPDALEHFEKAIRSPYGMVLITGPTGSGKTTTLYSAVHTVNSPDINIMTAEDPVEYNLKGVNQVQINDEIGRTFAAALRSFLRQDPDVILVGETRDLETAQIGIRAALTGHLVLTTLHTNDCPSTIARLLDMGIPPFLVSSSLLLIVAQRLARRVCKDCREPYEADEDSLAPYGHLPQGLGSCTFYRGKGCATCNFTGMRSRVAIYEVMPVSPELRDLILRNAATSELREVAESQGMRTLRQAGLLKVIDGTTTVEEVLRVTLA